MYNNHRKKKYLYPYKNNSQLNKGKRFCTKRLYKQS
jgi:hypothetical protein